jgi:transposase-like protein
MDERFSPSPGEETTRALIATLQEQVRTLQRENAALRQQLDVLCQRMFGKRSERVDPRQL